MKHTQSPNTPASSKNQRKSFRKYLQTRQDCDIKVKNFTTKELAVFIKDLQLDEGFERFIQNRKKLLDDYIYIFEVNVTSPASGERTWILKKRYVDFEILCKQINKDLTNANISTPCPHPLQFSKVKAQNNNVNVESVKHLEHFFTELVNNDVVRNNSQSFYDFLGISSLPLTGGPKIYKEGYLDKRTGGRFSEGILQTYVGIVCKRWQKRWFIVCDEGILYTTASSSNQIREMLFFDQSFSIKYGRKATGSKTGLIIITSTRKLHLRASNLFEALDWISSIKEASKSCRYVDTDNPNHSFAPVRESNALCQWYIDGENYYSDVCDQMMAAKEEIFITGWWLSPELHLKRPVKNDDSRLDNVLKKAAERGVKVCIFIYKEVKQVLYNDSAYTKSTLEKLHPNIKVLTHPKEFLFLWSHHEKLVIVDQNVGFLGGLDLCYGRMDVNAHPLNDPTYHSDGLETFPGIEYSNPRKKDFVQVKNHLVSQIKKNVDPRLPWHDVTTMVVGDAVKDLTRHFIQCWNFAQIDIKGKNDYFITLKAEKESQEKEEKAMRKSQALRSSLVGMIKKSVFNVFKSPRPKGGPTSLENIRDERAFETHAENKTCIPSSPIRSEKIENQEVDIGLHIPISDHKDIIEVNSESCIMEEEAKLDDNEKPAVKYNILQTQFTKGQTIVFKTIRTDSLAKPAGDDFPLGNDNADLFQQLRVKRASLSVAKYEVRSHFKSDSPLVLKAKDLKKTGSLILKPDQEKEENIEYSNLLRRTREKEKSPSSAYFKNIKSILKKKVIEKEKEHDKFLIDSAPHSPINSEFKTVAIGDEGLSKKEDKKEKINDTFFEKNMLQPSWLKRNNSIEGGSYCCQIVRSASSWSIGLNFNKPEYSIQEAYIKLIQRAKDFIYIENQFFISGTAGEPVANGIAEALVYRILEAHQLKKRFRVVVFLPLMPAFEGEIDDPKAKVLRTQLYWQYRTISRGNREQQSMFELLKAKGIDRPEDYIQFFSLRQHARLNGVPVTEMIYIHTKLMIVDDSIAILGSANINDRSMQGTRDSELGIIIEDKNQVKTHMNGKLIDVGKYSHSLRTGLWMEHLDLSEEEVEDPLDTSLIQKMSDMALKNTEIYREVFACYPDDNISRLEEIKDWRNKKNLHLYDKLHQQIRGSIVQFPLRFLSDEALRLGMTDLEYYVPEVNFI